MMVTATKDAKPARVSARIKERRQQTQQHDLVVPQDLLQPSVAKQEKVTKNLSSHSGKDDIIIAVGKKRKADDVSPKASQKTTKELPPQKPVPPTKNTVASFWSPTLCRQPPFPLYGPGATPSFRQGMESVINILRSCRNIAVLTGAGISVSCGIPDFRSKGVGLYSVLDCEALGLSCPEELFDWEFFQNNPRPFFQFAKKLYFPLDQNQKVQPSDSHKLLRLLQDRKQLRRVYSQNIDGLEEEAGVLTKNVVYAHGSLKWATCLTCKRKVPCRDFEGSILDGVVPCCQAPSRKALASSSSGSNTAKPPVSPPKPIIRREPSARQRSRQQQEINSSDSSRTSFDRQSSSSSDSDTCGGILKPNVTFFGQVLPDNVSRCLESDRKKVDALIVIGTSLSVAPISKVIGYLPANIPRILINRTIVHPRTQYTEVEKEKDEPDVSPDFRDDYIFDAYLLGNCDDVTRALVKHLAADDVAKTQDITGSGTTTPATSDQLEEMGRLLSEVRQGKNVWNEDKEALYQIEDWKTARVPAERVFLFPGAQPPTPSAEDTIVQLQEVCHCNACSKRIETGNIHKCLQCFDFDLCSSCFPNVSKQHNGGTHQFGLEAVKQVIGK
jgi:NAD-dependent SIR2 family protein deacetylase